MTTHSVCPICGSTKKGETRLWPQAKKPPYSVAWSVAHDCWECPHSFHDAITLEPQRPAAGAVRNQVGLYYPDGGIIEAGHTIRHKHCHSGDEGTHLVLGIEGGYVVIDMPELDSTGLVLAKEVIERVIDTEEDLRRGPDAEPEPTPGMEDVTPLVIADLQGRSDFGARKYGTVLQTFNGRQALVDLYHELLDGVQYLRQAIQEGDVQAARIAEMNERVSELKMALVDAQDVIEYQEDHISCLQDELDRAGDE